MSHYRALYRAYVYRTQGLVPARKKYDPIEFIFFSREQAPV